LVTLAAADVADRTEALLVPRSSALLRADDLAQHGPVLLAAARLLMRNDADAHDLVQTTYEIALRRGHTLRDPDKILPWLLAIQTREAFRLRRRLQRLVTREVPDVADDSAVPEYLTPLREALDGLPTRERVAVILHHMVGLSVAETAAVMGVSENTAKSQLRIGLGRLRETLK
jgi:RNA polymerase sigma factor (sigma-70 family)